MMTFNDTAYPGMLVFLLTNISNLSFYLLTYPILVFTSCPFLKMAGDIVLGSVAISAVSTDVLPYILVAIKASFLKLGMCNICIKIGLFDKGLFNFW